jgi:cell division protein FtsB
MKELQRTIVRYIIGFEIALILFFYVFGRGGIYALRHADALNKELMKDIKQLDEEIAKLQEELDEREKNPFYKESIARKELQMGYNNETIYLLPQG